MLLRRTGTWLIELIACIRDSHSECQTYVATSELEAGEPWGAEMNTNYPDKHILYMISTIITFHYFVGSLYLISNGIIFKLFIYYGNKSERPINSTFPSSTEGQFHKHSN